MNQPIIKMSLAGNVYTRLMHFVAAGDTEQGHTHEFDHATLLAHGAVRIRAKGKETDFFAPHLIWINKDVEHELIALEPNTICACIHAVRDNDTEEIIDPSMVPAGAERV